MKLLKEVRRAVNKSIFKKIFWIVISLSFLVDWLIFILWNSMLIEAEGALSGNRQNWKPLQKRIILLKRISSFLVTPFSEDEIEVSTRRKSVSVKKSTDQSEKMRTWERIRSHTRNNIQCPTQIDSIFNGFH